MKARTNSSGRGRSDRFGAFARKSALSAAQAPLLTATDGHPRIESSGRPDWIEVSKRSPPEVDRALSEPAGSRPITVDEAVRHQQGHEQRELRPSDRPGCEILLQKIGAMADDHAAKFTRIE